MQGLGSALWGDAVGINIYRRRALEGSCYSLRVPGREHAGTRPLVEPGGLQGAGVVSIFWKWLFSPDPTHEILKSSLCFAGVEKRPRNSSGPLPLPLRLERIDISVHRDSSGIRATRAALFRAPCTLSLFNSCPETAVLINVNVLLRSGLVVTKGIASKQIV